ncbi:MAG: hypothetical protein K0R71_1370 [Bacillales bacterium]|jgi:hypothetical protein|nr:hypothetical protein [Bacillales bacterium]
MKKLSLTFILVLVLAFTAGCGNSISLPPLPSGDDCHANSAYMQTGVDNYLKEFGKLPANLNVLLEKTDGKGPFIEKVLQCPEGRTYYIDEEGIVKEQ